MTARILVGVVSYAIAVLAAVFPYVSASSEQLPVVDKDEPLPQSSAPGRSEGLREGRVNSRDRFDAPTERRVPGPVNPLPVVEDLSGEFLEGMLALYDEHDARESFLKAFGHVPVVPLGAADLYNGSTDEVTQLSEALPSAATRIADLNFGQGSKTGAGFVVVAFRNPVSGDLETIVGQQSMGLAPRSDAVFLTASLGADFRSLSAFQRESLVNLATTKNERYRAHLVKTYKLVTSFFHSGRFRHDDTTAFCVAIVGGKLGGRVVARVFMHGDDEGLDALLQQYELSYASLEAKLERIVP